MTMMMVFRVQRKTVKFTLKLVNAFGLDLDSDSSKPSMHVLTACVDGQTQILRSWTYSSLIKILSTFYQCDLVNLEGEWPWQYKILCSPSHLFFGLHI